MQRSTTTKERPPVCLVVDESAAEREASGAMLRACGLRVLAARSAHEARAVLRCMLPDLIVLDADALGAPELVRALRGDPDFAGVRVVGHGARADALGVDLVVGRTCAPAALHAVRALASSKRVAAAA